MAKLTTAEFIDAIKELSVLELNELVKACEEEFGVSAAAGVVMAGPAAGPAAEEKDEFDVELTEGMSKSATTTGRLKSIFITPRLQFELPFCVAKAF